MQVERACFWSGDFVRCLPLSAALGATRRLLDLDGAVIATVEEAGKGRANFVWLEQQGNANYDAAVPCFLLDVNFHLGTKRTVAVCSMDTPPALADAICDSEDVCFMRRFDRSYMRQHIEDGLARFSAALASGRPMAIHVARQDVSVPYILIGEPPEDWHGVNLSHFGKCTSCHLRTTAATAAAALASAPVLEVGTKCQLFADDHAVRSMVQLRRQSSVATKVNGGDPILQRDKPWEDITFGGKKSPCFCVHYTPR